MIADVPVGAFLSGGIDSNIILALMQEVAGEPVKTFSIGFPDFPNEDRNLAALTAGRLGADHHPIDCRAEDFAMLPDIAHQLDEPVGDAIVVPMRVLAREARKHVKVVLSGEGADEILGGYIFHRKLRQIAAAKALVPAPMFDLASLVARGIPVPILERLFDYPGALGEDGKGKIVAMIREIGRQPLVSLYRSSVFAPRRRRHRRHGTRIRVGGPRINEARAAAAHDPRRFGAAGSGRDAVSRLAAGRHPDEGRQDDDGPFAGGSRPIFGRVGYRCRSSHSRRGQNRQAG